MKVFQVNTKKALNIIKIKNNKENKNGKHIKC